MIKPTTVLKEKLPQCITHNQLNMIPPETKSIFRESRRQAVSILFPQTLNEMPCVFSFPVYLS